MTDQKEKRKFPRYTTDLEVLFYDQKRTRGRIVDISKKGCMLTLKDGATRPVGSLITFRVFFEGKAQLEENTMPSISMAELTKSKTQPEYSPDRYPHAVKILALVARHTIYNDKAAMGIQIKDINDADMLKWNKFMEKINIEHFMRPTPVTPPPSSPMRNQPVAKKVEIPQNIPTYTLKFKSLETTAHHLPNNTEDTFFIPSKEQPEGRVLQIVMIHPTNKTKLVFNCVVSRFGTSPGSDDTLGVYVTYQNLDPSLKHQINVFLNYPIFK
jgi:hypothetical protein